MAIVKNLASVMTTASITSSATSIPVNRTNVFGASQNPLDNPFYVTIMPASGSEPANTTNSEIALVTGISGSNLIVTRGQRSTTARAFSAGAIVTMGIYAEDAVLLGGGGTTTNTTAYRKKLVDKDGNTIIPIMGDIGPVYTARLSSASGGIARYEFTPDTPVENSRVYAVKFPTPTVNNATIILGDGVTSGSILVPPVAATDSPNYELLDTTMINDTEPLLLMYNGVQWICLNQKRKVATADLDDGAVGWKYLGQVKLASAGASLTFNLPAQYDNYKIIAAGEMATGSNASCQLQLLRSESVIPSAWGVLDVNGSSIVAGIRNAENNQFSMTTCNQYDTINMEMTSFKTSSTQWRKYQGYQMRMGSAAVMRQYNGRFNSSTEPNQVRIWTSATFGAGAVIRVWASNNT